MHCFSTVHIVWMDAFFLRIVYFRRLICCFMVIICVAELSGVIRAPRALVGVDRGIGVMSVLTALMSYA